LRDGNHQQALGTAAGSNDLVVTALDHRFETVQAQSALLALLAMTTETGRLQYGADVFRVSDAFFIGSGRKFAEIRISSEHSTTHGREAGEEQKHFGFHRALVWRHCGFIFLFTVAPTYRNDD
jgi:hypothetical protein